MSIEVAWRTVEEILKEHGDRPPSDDSRLRAQLHGLAADPDGLARLAGRVRKRRDWFPGSSFLRSTIKAALEAWEKRAARHPTEARQLAQAIVGATSPEDEAHRLSLRLLWWADRDAFAKAVHDDLRSSSPGDLVDWLQQTCGPFLQRDEWLPLLRRLRGLPCDISLNSRLEQAIARLERPPAGPRSSDTGARESRGVGTDRPVAALPSPAAGSCGPGHKPARVGSPPRSGTSPPPGSCAAGDPDGSDGPRLAPAPPVGHERPRTRSIETARQPDRPVGEPGNQASPPPPDATAPPPTPEEAGDRPGPGSESPPAVGEGPTAAGAKRPRTKKEPKGKEAKGNEGAPGAASADLDTCLAEVKQVILRCFQDRDRERAELLAQCARVQKENERLQAEGAERRDRVDDLLDQLERARRIESEAAERFQQLEARLADREEAARRAAERAERLEQDLIEALAEIEAAERRARDDVHRANLQRDQAVQGFRYRIREQVLPFLSEANDDGGAAEGLTPEQGRLRLRLRQVLDALRDLGVDAD